MFQHLGSVLVIFFLVETFLSFHSVHGLEAKKVELSEFETMINTKGMTIALYYEEDATYAEEIEDFFTEVGRRLSSAEFPETRIFRIDVRTNRVLAQRAQVSTFPTILVYLTTFQWDGHAITIHVMPHKYTGDLSSPLFNVEGSENSQQLVLKFDENKLSSLRSFIKNLYPSTFDMVQEQKQKRSLELQKEAYFPQRHIHKINFLSTNQYLDLLSPEKKTQLSLINFHFGADYTPELALFAQTHADWKVFRVQCFSEKQLCELFGVQFDPSLIPSAQPSRFVILQGDRFLKNELNSEQTLADWCGSISEEDQWLPAPVPKPEETVSPNVNVLADETSFYEAIHQHIKTLKGREKFVFFYYKGSEAEVDSSATKPLLATFHQLPNLLPNIHFYELNVEKSQNPELLSDFHIGSLPAIQLAHQGKFYQYEAGFEDFVSQITNFVDTGFAQSSNFDVKAEKKLVTDSLGGHEEL